MLKYPNCEICKLLKEIGLDDKTINDYHESKIGIEDLPEYAQIELIDFWKERGEL